MGVGVGVGVGDGDGDRVGAGAAQANIKGIASTKAKSRLPTSVNNLFLFTY